MIRMTIDRLLSFLLGVIVLIGSVYLTWTYFETTSQPPVKFLSIAILNKDVHAGEKLRLRVTFDRRRNCPGTAEQYIIRLTNDSEERVFSAIVPVALTRIGESINYIFSIKLPDKMDLGTYVFRGNNQLDCAGTKFSIELPEAGFQVVP